MPTRSRRARTSPPRLREVALSTKCCWLLLRLINSPTSHSVRTGVSGAGSRALRDPATCGRRFALHVGCELHSITDGCFEQS